MKITGIVLDGPRVETVVLPRQGGDIVILAQAVLDFDDFDKMCKEPVAPIKQFPGGLQTPILDDPEYVANMGEYAEMKTNWLLIQSLKATKGLTWDTIKVDDPKSWGNYQEELKEAGFSIAEVGAIVRLVADACGLNQTKIDEATKLFLAGQAETQNAS